MSKRRRDAPESARAAVLGGAVTCERLRDAAVLEGRGHATLVRSLLAQALPTDEDIARIYATRGGPLRLDASLLLAAPLTNRLLDIELLRRHRCVPVELMTDLCVLAVEEGRASVAVRALRDALRCDILPVIVEPRALDEALARLLPPPAAVRIGPVRRRRGALHARFRALALERDVLEAVPLAAPATQPVATRKGDATRT